MTQGEQSRIVVFQDRVWLADPKLGAFVVYVDRKRVGVAPVMGESAVAVTPGAHTVRVRQWYYRSPAVQVAVESGATVRLRADVPSGRGIARMVFTPWRCLNLATATSTLAPDVRHEVVQSMKRGRSAQVVAGITSLLGLVLFRVGIALGPALVVAGAILFIGGTVFGISNAIRARRETMDATGRREPPPPNQWNWPE